MSTTRKSAGAVAGINPQAVWDAQPAVRKVVSFVARNVAAVPLHAFRRDSDTDRSRLAGSAVERALRSFRLVRDLVTDALMTDTCCAVLIDGRVRRIAPGLLTAEVGWSGDVLRLDVSTPDGPERIDHLPHALVTGWSSTGLAFGTSPLQTLAALLDEQARAVAWRAQVWERAAKITGTIQYPERFKDPKAREEFQAAFNEFVAAKAGGVPVLERGMKFEPVESLHPADALDLEGRQLTDAQVASAFHVPPELVGARETTFSNLSAFRAMLYGPVLGPLLTEVEQALNEQIVPALADDDPAVYVEFGRDQAQAGSLVEQAAYLSAAVGGPWLTRAEARGRANLPQLDGTDELIVPLNVIEGGLANPRATAPPATAPVQPRTTD